MRVLLTTLNAKYIHTNLAIRILYEMNHDFPGLEWKEFTIKENPEEIKNHCSEFDIIAFSCYIWNITPTLSLIKSIKKDFPQIKIVLGGPEVSYENEKIIALPEIDFIIYGEGEIPFQSFLHCANNYSIVPGLIWKKDQEIIKNPAAPNYDIQLFENSMPYRFDEVESLKNKVLYLETSRGCPYKCEFCLASLDNKVRYLPMETIKSTLLFLMQHGKVIKFLDRTFNIKKDFTLEIFQFILDNYKEGNIFQFEITADILHPDIIQFIHEKVPKNLFRFEIGIQSVNKDANLAVSRKQNFEKTKSIIYQVQNQVELHLDLIVGLPHDYFSDIKTGIETVFKLYPPEFQLGFLKFLKGTPVREKYPEHNYVFDVNPPYQIIESKFLSREELQVITNCEEALEIYWNSKRAIHSLKFVAENLNIFDFLQELNIYFRKAVGEKPYTLGKIFEILFQFSKLNYTEHKTLHQLIILDYYLHHSIKPKDIFDDVLEKTEKNKVMNSLRLNHHQYRFAMLPIHFNWKLFESELKIIPENDLLIVQFNGKDKPELFSHNNLSVSA